MKEVKLQKIPLERFIDILVDLWENGADFIDIIGIPNVDQDSINIAVKEEYINCLEVMEEDEEDFPIEREEYKIKKILLTEDDLEKLTDI
jgi:hypothetical protein